ncbi:GNAT family N-acetyltransferase [Oceanobacillus sp. CAU 1775]
MKKKDIKDVRQVAQSSWRTTYEEIIPLHIQENFLANAYSPKMLKKRLKDTNIFVAEKDKEIIGFANYSPVTEEGKTNLYAIYLYKEHQGEGIGTAFLDKGIQELGAKEIVLNVERQNTPALQFYEAKGFKKIAEFDDDFDGHILHTIRMSLTVNE